MPVLLRRPGDLPSPDAYDRWLAIAAEQVPAADEKRLSNTGLELEKAFEAIVDTWQILAKDMGADRDNSLSHTIACAPNASDFGLMLAYSHLVTEIAGRNETALIVCGDPWLFRHLSQFESVSAGQAPTLWWPEIRLRIRGILARTANTARTAAAYVRLRHTRRWTKTGIPTTLVYGHPSSRPDGYDGYFGSIPNEIPVLQRLLHTDCRVKLATSLGRGGRAVPLAAWGSFADVFANLFCRWKPARRLFDGPNGWLIRRAEATEGGTAQAAAIHWQIACQNRWLSQARPRVIAWPWENHVWERALVRQARRKGIRTLGYQHSVVGRHMINYSSHSNADELESVPDVIFCTGRTTLEQLNAWGVPNDRLKIGGAARMPESHSLDSTDDAPVFLSLPFDGVTAAQMVETGRRLVSRGFRFVVKDHPMTPFQFDESQGMARTNTPFHEHKNLRALVYAASAVGLESALSGLPTIRFRPQNRIALDILPAGYELPTAGPDELGDALASPPTPPLISRQDVFAPVDLDLWRKELQ